ncbi:DUF6779 domain-containing protein [Mycobacterium noviomagense]|uniref:DUF6779 domain-containing protein n=1 Tax=Mycobacterium noviomagense TaxID=459858 RepID=A0A7I7PBI7_9MYCO|nr:DUF6779 domain-containing protein [Mycobacterium noviomagense]ORB12856.1 hypothetical protein BST37_15025 [Mycobacterium noviomagense]BBY05970.1 hypothetical protein MNVI_12880 [Mycobacterium noviomagense]
MTVLSRGARVRRGGRRPGWLLLTALLVLAIGASSALVFTNRVELLKLAVILALWAAVVAAFASVIYRRQSDVDQARVRDLKLVYDLQLDREISARREYELTVESQLRRELASELRAQAADEVAALRAELAALRTNLEILFDAELSQRPALETERTTVRGYSEWDREDESPRDRINRVASVRAEEAANQTEDSSIIDVPEEPLLPPRPAEPEPAPETYPAAEAYRTPETRAPAPEAYPAEGYRGSHWRPTEDSAWSPRARQPDQPDWSRAGQSDERGWAAQERFASQPQRHPEPEHDVPTPPSQPRFEPRHVAPQPEAAPPPRDWYAPPNEAPQRREPANEWQPVGSEGQWLPPGAPGSNWVSEQPDSRGVPGTMANGSSTVSQPVPDAPRGRHAGRAEPPVRPPGATAASWGNSRRPRHSAGYEGYGTGSSAPPEPSEPPAPEPPRRRRSLEDSPEGPSSGGQSVAELLARLQAQPTGGRRRRREE